MATAHGDSVQQRLTRRASRRSWWGDSLVAALWFTVAGALAFFIASGGLLALNPVDYVYSTGRAAGIVAAVLMLTQVLLISRAPWIERVLGHDRATRIHTTNGKIAFVLMLVHVGIIVMMTAQYEGNGVVEQFFEFGEFGWFMVTAQVGFGLFIIIVGTSLWIVRSRWKYETWFAVHMSVYVAIALVVPHQFLEGSTFRGGGPAWWFWLAIYVIAFGSLIAFRMIRPLVVFFRHGLRVSEVKQEVDGSTSITMTGRNLEKLQAKPGQFFIWRFLDRRHGREAHPFSLSRMPDDKSLRITVRPSGDLTRGIGSVQVGTRVMADGPLGVFTEQPRTQRGTVLIAAGVGITPIRALLDDPTTGQGPCTIIVRGSSASDVPLMEEVDELARRRGATVHRLWGPRGDRWVPADQDVTLADLVPDVAHRDVYICGPEAWAIAVETEALEAGCDHQQVHREQFAW